MRIRGGKADIVAVARLARVSPATVSRSFNHPGLVRASTRKRIEAAVEESGYIRNRALRTMHGKRSGTIGMIVPTVDNAIFSEMIQSFADAISHREFTLLIATHGYDLRGEYGILRKLMEHRVDGVALIGLDRVDAALKLIERQGIPAIAGWNYAADSPIPCVGPDNREAGILAARHLVDLGHERIAMIFPETKGNDRARMRFQGALSALESSGIRIPRRWRARSSYRVGEAKRVCAGLLSRESDVTALLCGNDIIAHGAMQAARKLRIDVPGDLSILGIGDFEGSADFEPALSSVRIPAKRIGTLAGELLVEAIAEKFEANRFNADKSGANQSGSGKPVGGGGADSIARIRLDVELTPRATTASPPGRSETETA